ncbi:MAG: METTL5 family protein [Methanosarcinales archaeon]
MRKKRLEILLERVSGFVSADPVREQYKTPAVVAAELLFSAYMRGDIEDRIVFDLGCGTGILGIGAELLGARSVVGVDCDIEALRVARENASQMGCSNISFVSCDVDRFCGIGETVVMNPPFGAQVRGGDRPFLDCAARVGGVIYSIHNKGSSDFVQKYISPSIVTDVKLVKFAIPRTFRFHRDDVKMIEVELCRIVVCDRHR